MKNSCFLKKSLTLLSALALSIGVSHAQVLMFDFGPVTVTGADQSNSPYHTANVSFTGTTWNRVQASDVASGLLFADGTAATGVSLNIGATTSDASTTIGLGNAPSINSALGGSTNTEIYGGTSVGTDGISTSTSGNTRYVGFQLGGLAAGTYDIYLTSRNTSTNNAYDQIAYTGTSATSGDFNAVTLALSNSLSYANGSDAISAWELGENYLKFTLTVASGDFINLAVVGGAANERRGFLNSVQIIAVPEPTSMVLLAGGLVAVTVFRRRARVAA